MEILPNWHPIFVHFTVALFTLSVLLFVASNLIRQGPFKTQVLTVANWNLWIGGLFTIVTLIMGWLAYNSVAHDTPSHVQMTTHKNWAFGAAGAFAALILWSLFLALKKIQPGFIFALFALASAGVLGATAFHGGEAVYRYGLGVKSLPKIAGTGGHGSHTHAPGQGHDKPKTEAQPKTDKPKAEGHSHAPGEGHGEPKTETQPKVNSEGHNH